MNLEHHGIITDKSQGKVGAAGVMMPSPSQVIDHRLIFHISMDFRQIHHWQNKEEERIGEEREEKSMAASSSNLAVVVS